MKKSIKRLLKVVGIIIVLGVFLTLLGAGLFVMNGVWLAAKETPVVGVVEPSSRNSQHHTFSIVKDHATLTAEPVERDELKVFSYNIAKGSIYRGGLNFEDPDVVIERLSRIAELINTEKPDLVFLSEAIFECGPWQVNQVAFLAWATGMQSFLLGENYNFGLPFFRIVGGNAILARFPILPVANPDLAGRKPFYITTNNRRILWGEMTVNETKVLLGAIHNDSFDLTNNLAQSKQILDDLGGRPALLAGDFNANSHEDSMQLFQQSGQFSGEFQGPNTFSVDNPQHTIDFILAPKEWELIEHRVIQHDASDHFPIVSIFRLKP
jgi:endonuclease/exonuclease/phosphatase family metal-dependent hydrolase